MNEIICYLLGLFTAILLIVIAYIISIYSTSFRSAYTSVVCNFSTANPNAPV
ncbi:MAG: hypothetical protein Solivirus3_10 [Solivirus sp.]|uniref:Uncharacterized protein n=1 Tax=Solivirus sp. TaxID=2487772 RepID=A0A3G5AFQ0_9VIRU|nr:MAG: hypothetical protein Solivirus3_10 [Solivirus sp.]